MIFKSKKHNSKFYSILLSLSRNIFFYNNINLRDTFETRLYLIFFHFSIILMVFKQKNIKFEQDIYDSLFLNIENNLRELGFGDVAVNKKMKDFNKVFYDILLKLNIGSKDFKVNNNLVFKYFNELKVSNEENINLFSSYFTRFYNFCFELPIHNVIEDCERFKY